MKDYYSYATAEMEHEFDDDRVVKFTLNVRISAAEKETFYSPGKPEEIDSFEIETALDPKDKEIISEWLRTHEREIWAAINEREI